MPSYRFAFRDKRPTAAVRLTPQPVQVQMHGKHRIALSEQQALLHKAMLEGFPGLPSGLPVDRG